MTTNLVLPMYLESFYELYKRGSLQLDKNKCITIQNYNEKGYPEVDPVDFTNRFPYFETEDQALILECQVDKKRFEAVRFKIEGIAFGDSLTLNHISAENDIQWLHVEDIKRVFPLSQNAASILPSKIGEEIFIEKPVFQTLVEKAFNIQEKDIQNKGINALFQINGLDISCDRETLDILFEQAANLKSSYSQPQKHDRFLLYALVYERREPFPKSDIGLLFDLCKILAEREQAPDFRKTKFYEKINSIKSDLENADINAVLKYFEYDDSYKTVRNMASSSDPKQKDYIAAALFIKYKESLRDDSYNPLDMAIEIQTLFDLFPEETTSALYLLGKFFSYNRFYNALYYSKRLRFLKSNIAESDVTFPLEDVQVCKSSLIDSADEMNAHLTKKSQEELPLFPPALDHENAPDSEDESNGCAQAFEQSADIEDERKKEPSTNEDSKAIKKAAKKSRTRKK